LWGEFSVVGVLQRFLKTTPFEINPLVGEGYSLYSQGLTIISLIKSSVTTVGFPYKAALPLAKFVELFSHQTRFDFQQRLSTVINLNICSSPSSGRQAVHLYFLGPSHCTSCVSPAKVTEEG
jgi:hypothetical protein